MHIGLIILELSSREMEIVRLLLEGKNSVEMASHLNISRHTVDTHRRKILKKTGMKSTNELIIEWYKGNAIKP